MKSRLHYDDVRALPIDTEVAIRVCLFSNLVPALATGPNDNFPHSVFQHHTHNRHHI